MSTDSASDPRDAGSAKPRGSAAERARWVPEVIAFYQEWRRSYRQLNRGSGFAAPSVPLPRY